jgi:hypothetical protein
MPASEETLDDRRYFFLGCAFLGVLGLLAWRFYLERTCFLDSAFILFRLLVTGSARVVVNRYSGLLPQIPPLIAAKLGLSLKWVLLAYSLSFIALLAGVYLVIGYWLKQRGLALALLLASVIMLSHGFYWIPNDLPQSIWWIALLYGILYSQASKAESLPMKGGLYLCVGGLVTLITFSHPLSIIPLLFMHGYWLLQQREWRSSFAWLVPVLVIALWVVKNVVFKNSYDDQRIDSLSNFVTLFPNYLMIHSNRLFVTYSLDDYFLAMMMLATVVGFYIRRREWLKLSWLIVFFGGYLLLINISLANGVARFYLELQYQPLAFMIAVPFVLEALPALVPRQVAFWLIAIILLSRVAMIFAHREPYAARLNWHRTTIERVAPLEGNRFLIAEQDVPMEKLIMGWASGYESLLISTIMDPAHSKTYVIDKDLNRFDRQREDLFQHGLQVQPAAVLPTRYFSLTPSPYRQLERNQIAP